MLKHVMRKCKVVNYVDKDTKEWITDLIETKKLEKLHLPGCTVQRRGTTPTSRSTTLQISTRRCLERLRTQSLARKRESRILDGTDGDD